MNKGLLTRIQADAKKYYGEELNIVQLYADPKVANCYVVRVEDKTGNWCFVVNYGYGDDINQAMIEDHIELKPGQKITKRDFGDLRFV